MNEQMEYGKKEVKIKEENVNEIYKVAKDGALVEPKTKIKKEEKFKKDEAVRE